MYLVVTLALTLIFFSWIFASSLYRMFVVIALAPQDLPAWEVLRCFKMISDDTCRVLGLNPAEAHPEWFIQTV